MSLETKDGAGYPEAQDLHRFVDRRKRVAQLWHTVFLGATVIGVMALLALLYNVITESFGYVAYQNQVDPQVLVRDYYAAQARAVPDGALTGAGANLAALPSADLVALLTANVSKGRARALVAAGPLEGRTEVELAQLLTEEVVKPKIVASWSLIESMFDRPAIEAAALAIPNARLEFRSWVTAGFLTSPQSSKPEYAGVRTAILGSLWVVFIAFIFSVPLGVGAAVYLEEYAGESRVGRWIETNINNLAGVPSIIYGMLGLAVFVRAMQAMTSGRIFGAVDPTTANGRTVASAGLTLGLLILPLIIINAREAVRAVPNAFREAGYGLGATKWQTIRAHVLPNAIPGILTGVILAISRALGETAPLVVIGAATFIVVDPNGPFSKFTTLPIQIYQWTARPQQEFQHLAAAAIMVLLVLLLAMNAAAIVLRNRYARSY